MFCLSIGFVSAHDINITFYDESTIGLIPEVTITDSNTSVYTSDVNGFISLDISGIKQFIISKTGYDSRKLEFNFNADSNFNFLLNPSGQDSAIQFLVKDENNNLWNNKYLQFIQSEHEEYWEKNSSNTFGGLAISSNGKYVLGGYINPYLSTNFGETFSTISLPNSPNYNSKYFVSSTGQYMLIANRIKLYKSINFGASWTELQPAGAVDKDWSTIAISDDGLIIFAGVGETGNGRLYKSSNGGTSWTELQPAGAVDKQWETISISNNGNYIVIGVFDGRLYKSSNGGTSWTELQPAGAVNKYWYTSKISENGEIIIVGNIGRLYKSSNGGTSWTELQPAGAVDKDWSAVDLSADGTIIFAGNTDRLYKSSNGGTSWTELQPIDDDDYTYLSVKLSSLNNVFIATYADGFYKFYPKRDFTVINSLLTNSSGIATASLDPNGDYNAVLYDQDSNLSNTYTKTVFTVNKPQQEISPGTEISPYDITVGGLLNYSLTNQTASSVPVGIFAGTLDSYTFSVVDYNANPADRQYLERSYVIKVPMGTGYQSAITYQPYLIGVTDVIVPRIYVLDQLTRTIQGAEVYISTSINFTETIVESGLTDSGGVFQFSAIPLKNYYVSIYYLGVFRGSFLIKPRTSDDVFYVTIDRSTAEEIANTFLINIDLSQIKENVPTDENVSVIGTITSNYNYISSYTIQAYQGSTLIYEDTTLATGKTININKEIDISLFQPYWDIRIVVTANYSIGGVSGTQSATKRIMISNQIDKISLFRTARQQLGQPLAILLSLILTAIILAIITLSGLPIPPAVTGLVGITILGVFMFLSWLDVGVVILGIDIGRLMYLLLVGISIYMLTRIGSV